MGVRSKQIIKRLNAEGYELVKITGSHHKFRKGDKIVIVPHPKKDLPIGATRHLWRKQKMEQ